MRDRFGRNLDYLRISVTDRCNLRCRYCMPSRGVKLVPTEQILSFEEMFEVTKTAVSLGVSRLRLTGGEPLIRRNIEVLVGMLASVAGVKDFGLTTNGILLEQYSEKLATAGLKRVNVSLDTIRPDRYAHITRGGDIRRVFRGIEAAQRAGLSPIKLNCVVAESSTEPDAAEVADFGRENGLQVRFIRMMDSALGKFSVVEGGSGGDCPRCNRLRLSASGDIRPCLFSDHGFSVRKLGVEEALRRAVREKPEAGGPCSNNWIRAVGG